MEGGEESFEKFFKEFPQCTNPDSCPRWLFKMVWESRRGERKGLEIFQGGLHRLSTGCPHGFHRVLYTYRKTAVRFFFLRTAVFGLYFGGFLFWIRPALLHFRADFAFGRFLFWIRPALLRVRAGFARQASACLPVALPPVPRKGAALDPAGSSPPAPRAASRLIGASRFFSFSFFIARTP